MRFFDQDESLTCLFPDWPLSKNKRQKKFDACLSRSLKVEQSATIWQHFLAVYFHILLTHLFVKDVVELVYHLQIEEQVEDVLGLLSGATPVCCCLKVGMMDGRPPECEIFFTQSLLTS